MLEKIKSDTLAAMRGKLTLELGVLRMLKSAIENAQIAKKDHAELTTPEITGLIRKQIAQRQDSVKQFTSGGREDLVEKELKEIEVLERYLPAQWSDDVLEAKVAGVITELGATTKKDMGRVIQAASDLADGACDNKRISQLVGQML